jgi:hypothetical protein
MVHKQASSDKKITVQNERYLHHISLAASQQAFSEQVKKMIARILHATCTIFPVQQNAKP